MSTTDNPEDPALTRGADDEPREQAGKYLVLSDAERAKGFVQPVRDTYRHETCGQETRMTAAIAESFARRPDFYGSTYCTTCRMHRLVGVDGEFVWLDGSKVGT